MSFSPFGAATFPLGQTANKESSGLNWTSYEFRQLFYSIRLPLTEMSVEHEQDHRRNSSKSHPSMRLTQIPSGNPFQGFLQRKKQKERKKGPNGHITELSDDFPTKNRDHQDKEHNMNSLREYNDLWGQQRMNMWKSGAGRSKGGNVTPTTKSFQDNRKSCLILSCCQSLKWRPE